MARRTKADREMENMIALMILIPIAILKGIGLIIAFVAKLIGFIIVFFDNIIKKRNEQIDRYSRNYIRLWWHH